MGAAHCEMLLSQKETSLVAVADVGQEADRAAGERYGATYFTDYKELIRNSGVEAVIIVTPHYFHPPIAEYAARHGIHVLSEKPIAVTVKAADHMVRVCR